MFGLAPFETSQQQLDVSAYRGRPEVVGGGSKRRDRPNADLGDLKMAELGARLSSRLGYKICR
jgi:hypothetical protein